MSEIILCFACEGKGYGISEELVDYHKNIYDRSKKTCHMCNGTGRLVKKTVITHEPYDPNQFVGF